MKKYLLIVPFLISFKLYSFDGLYGMYYLDLALRPGVNVASTLDERNISSNNPVPTIGLELGTNLAYATVGGGIHYNNKISFSDSNIDGSFRPMPIYGFAKLNLFPLIFKPYVVGKYGFTRIEESSGFKAEGGKYWAIGIGIDVFNFLAEMVYQNSSIKIDGTSDTLSQLQLSVGVKLF